MQLCPICSSASLFAFIDLGHAPVFCNVQWNTREEAQRAKTAPLSLSACSHCGHIFNRSYDESVLAYSPGYDNTQHFSSTFQAYAHRLVDRLIETYDIRGKSVVDIGCGRGDLLQLIANRGGNRGFGFDPSFAGSMIENSGNITISREYFGSSQSAELRPALVCLRHVLEHVPNPQPFLEGMRDALAAAGAPILYLEVPNGEHLLKTSGVWDYIYEHVSYFSRTSLHTALEKAGFEVLKLYEDFGGQFLCADVRPAKTARVGGASTAPSASASDLRSAAEEMNRKLAWWKNWTRAVTERRLPVTVWGAGSKGVTFLNFMNLTCPGPVEFIVDQNPGKAGRFIAGTGQVVVPPDAEHLRQFSEIVLMNSIYADEVAAQLASVGSTAKLISADGPPPK